MAAAAPTAADMQQQQQRRRSPTPDKLEAAVGRAMRSTAQAVSKALGGRGVPQQQQQQQAAPAAAAQHVPAPLLAAAAATSALWAPKLLGHAVMRGRLQWWHTDAFEEFVAEKLQQQGAAAVSHAVQCCVAVVAMGQQKDEDEEGENAEEEEQQRQEQQAAAVAAACEAAGLSPFRGLALLQVLLLSSPCRLAFCAGLPAQHRPEGFLQAFAAVLPMMVDRVQDTVAKVLTALGHPTPAPLPLAVAVAQAEVRTQPPAGAVDVAAQLVALAQPLKPQQQQQFKQQQQQAIQRAPASEGHHHQPAKSYSAQHKQQHQQQQRQQDGGRNSNSGGNGNSSGSAGKFSVKPHVMEGVCYVARHNHTSGVGADAKAALAMVLAHLRHEVQAFVIKQNNRARTKRIYTWEEERLFRVSATQVVARANRRGKLSPKLVQVFQDVYDDIQAQQQQANHHHVHYSSQHNDSGSIGSGSKRKLSAIGGSGGSNGKQPYAKQQRQVSLYEGSASRTPDSFGDSVGLRLVNGRLVEY